MPPAFITLRSNPADSTPSRPVITTAAPASGSVAFAGLTLDFEYSIDGGATYLPMTDSLTGSLNGNPAAQALPGPDTWGWDSLVDVPLPALYGPSADGTFDKIAKARRLISKHRKAIKKLERAAQK